VDAAGTVVRRYSGARTSLSDITVLAVDPGTFARWAYWDTRFAGPSLAEDLRRVAAAPAGGAIPVLAVRGRYQADVLPDGYPVRIGSHNLTVSVVDRPKYFPGTHDTNATVVVSAANLPTIADTQPTTEVWGDDEAALQHAIGDQVKIRAPLHLDATVAVSQANFAGLAYSFSFLTALGVLVGLVAIGALLLYLETRQRTRVSAYAMTRRMGLTAGTHLRSLLVEMGILVGAAALLGTALSAAAVLMVYRQLDFNVDWRPPPALSVPVVALAAIGLATTVVAVLAASHAHRAAARTKPAEILRLSA
jgi:putative ABC transport system permease protein